MALRGIFHFHSCYSFDSITSIKSIADVIERNKFDFAVLTDHDNIEGCFALRDELQKRDLQVDVPVAVEYSTDVGDIIVVGIEKYLEFSSADDLLRKVSEHAGITILPHPYDGHNLTEEIINKFDVIEIFNGRSIPQHNEKSRLLAKKYGKNTIYSSDAHLRKNLDNVVLKYHTMHSFVDNCRQGVFETEQCIYSSTSDLLYSQLIKSMKYRNPKIALRIIFGMVLRFLKVNYPSIYNLLKTTKELIR